VGDAAVVFSPATITAGSTVIKAGPALSSIPTIAEINGGSDWNQVIGLVNRRTSQVWPAMSLFSYLGDGEKPTASLVNALRTRINQIRVGVAQSNFNFGTAVSAGNRIRATEFTALRNSLNFIGTRNIGGSGGMKGWYRNDNPYGTQSGAAGYTNGPLVGKWSGNPIFNPDDRPITRFRTMTNFLQPTQWSANYGAVSLKIQVYAWTNSLENWTFEIWSSATDDSGYPSTDVAYNLDFFEGSIPFGTTGLYTVPLDVSRVAAHHGSRWSVIMGSDKELSNSGAGGTGHDTDRAAAQCSDPVTDGVQCLLVLDWGF
jgi:hypothetical protein